MELFLPNLGLFIWTVVGFGIFAFCVAKFAWKPLLSFLGDRDKAIAESLAMAEKARAEYADLEKEKARMLDEAKEERARMQREAREDRGKIIDEAKAQASLAADKIMQEARLEIEREKEAMMAELRNQIAGFSVQIAEMILKDKLADTQAQNKVIADYLKEMKLN